MKPIISAESKALYQRALLLAVPMMIQNGITNAVGLVDNLMVGSLGTESMTGVSIAGQLIFVFNLAIFGALSGPGIFCAQYFGNKDVEGVRKSFRMKIWMVVICVLLGIGLFLVGDKFFIGLYLKGQAEGIDPLLTLSESRNYLHIMLIGFLPFSLAQVYSSTLRENNESTMPMVAGICGVVTDVLLNYLLIFGKFGFPAMGVKGAALATVLSRFVELSVVVIWTHAKRKKYTFIQKIYRTLLVEKQAALTMAKKSFPIMINEFLWSAGIICINQLLSRRSLSVVPAIAISVSLTNLFNVVFVAMGSAVGIVIGQMLGAGDMKDIKKKAFSLMFFTAFLSVGLSAILLILAPYFPNLKLYNTTEDVRNMATSFIILTALFFPLQGFLNAQYFTIRAGGKTFITFLADSGFTWVVCVLTVAALIKFTNLNVFAVYSVSLTLDVLKVAFGAFLIFKGIWITNLVKDDKKPENVSEQEGENE